MTFSLHEISNYVIARNLNKMANIEKTISQNGTLRFRARVRIKGFPPKSATFSKKSDAHKWALATENELRERKHFRYIGEDKFTVAQIIDRYLKDVLPFKDKLERSKSTEFHQLQWWKQQLGDFKLNELRRSIIAEARDKLRQSKNRYGRLYAPATVNKYISAISNVMNIAAHEWEIMRENPIVGVGKLKEPRGRDRFLSKEEIIRLISVCKIDVNRLILPIVLIALHTGARRGEILGLKWPDIDFERHIALLHNTKNGEKRKLPLYGSAYNELVKLRKRTRSKSGYVFSLPKSNKPIGIKETWNRVRRNACLEDFRFHDLRHTAASYLAMNGASLVEIAEILGHKTLNMVKRYSHISESHVEQVVKSMNNKLDSLISV